MGQAAVGDPMFPEAAAVDTFGDIPLTVVTATYPQGNGIDDPALMISRSAARTARR